ncbi:unnamed protein product [Schistocephalus solidus]|uniref:Uncharacterized protein n=1 Tax=Schistocephalus solidus TaxID=70667 RepID=A0A183T5Y2_SCHSO|nr:unnamed protein product [Schistocephalus solidus]
MFADDIKLPIRPDAGAPSARQFRVRHNRLSLDRSCEKPSKIKQEKWKSAKSEDDEIEDGEMANVSSSSSSEAEQEGKAAHEENEQPEPTEVRAATSDSVHGEYAHQARSRSTGPHIRLSEFEPLFVSERRIAPIFVSKEDHFTSLLRKLSSASLIHLEPNTKDCVTTAGAKFCKQPEAVVLPDDTAAAQSFQDDISWTLRRLKYLPYRPNENQLLFKLPVSEQSTWDPKVWLIASASY